jgi:hypothetical protein
MPMPSALTPEIATRFARAALNHVTREFPNKLDHVMATAEDAKRPTELHPIFFGSFDWHSCVHGYWLLATLLREFPEMTAAAAIRELLDVQITRENIAREVAYLERPESRGFERPYGWAWLLMLAAELGRQHRPEVAAATPAKPERRSWSSTFEPLAAAFVKRFLDFLPKATYAVRVGTHFNTAFAIALALEFAESAKNETLRDALRTKARAWYLNDADCQAWEPGGDDFLSSALMEAECMRRVLDPPEFQDWITRFLPQIAEKQPATLFQPAIVTDRSDGKIAHLDGLNLSRAWCWKSLASTWAEDDPRRAVAIDAVNLHLTASLPYVTGDYMGEHWLATFALLALRA